MPTRRTSRRSRGFSRNRRKLEWADFQLDGTTDVGASTVVDLLDTFAQLPGASVSGATIARIHLYLSISTAVTTGDGFNIGILVDQVDEVAPSPGVPSSTAHMVNTVSSPNADWMLFRIYDATPGYSLTSPNENFEFDVRAKRRLKEIGDTLLFCFDNVDAAATVGWFIHARTLLMMP